MHIDDETFSPPVRVLVSRKAIVVLGSSSDLVNPEPSILSPHGPASEQIGLSSGLRKL
jgi:hypothetical protein